MDEYFLIERTLDGDVRVEIYNKEQLLERLNSEEYGNPIILDYPNFTSDPQSWKGEHAAIIIKGKLIKPIPEEKIVKYNID